MPQVYDHGLAPRYFFSLAYNSWKHCVNWLLRATGYWRYLPTTLASIMLVGGSGKVPAGFLVFKTCGGSRSGPRWVRLPSTPAAPTINSALRGIPAVTDPSPGPLAGFGGATSCPSPEEANAYPESESQSACCPVFRIQDVTLGEPARGLIARYRGEFVGEDTATAYDQLAEALRAL